LLFCHKLSAIEAPCIPQKSWGADDSTSKRTAKMFAVPSLFFAVLRSKAITKEPPPETAHTQDICDIRISANDIITAPFFINMIKDIF